MQDFIKYHSLGNDLIIFDCLKKKILEDILHHERWHRFVKNICDRHFGVGADGVLVIKGNLENIPEVLVFNSDGTEAQNCLNGLRCVAHYLFTHHQFSKEFAIKIGSCINHCSVRISSKTSDQINTDFETFDPYVITSHVGVANYIKKHQLVTLVGTFEGHEVHIGNPHLIIFDKISLEWLQTYGKLLESHERFPNRTNVEFVWKKESKEKKIFDVMIYERGSGITLSCSSGAAAITGLLLEKKEITRNEKITFCMPGGLLDAWCDTNGEIVLDAKAQLVFKGSFKL